MCEARIKRLARIAADQFERANRYGETDEDKRYTRIIDGSKDHDAIRDLVYACHGGSMPSDWIYEAVSHVLACIAEDGSDANIESDIYTHELLTWLRECPHAIDACDRAAEEYGEPRDGGIVAAISLGQSFMLDEIRGHCLAYLETIVDDDTESEASL